MQPFLELGALIESRWRDKNYADDLFPAIASQTLSELRLTERVDPWEIVRWVHTTPSLPEQMDLTAKFGDPPLTVYVGHRFYIDVYFWLDGTTTIHQHAFSGAFQVLLGSSVQTTYDFEKKCEINPHFLTGEVHFSDVSLLGRGDIREIKPGSEFIHSLFHLDRPSATITIRTHKTSVSPVQYRYMKPFVALDPFFVNAALTRKVQTVELLLQMNHPEGDGLIGNLLDESDFQTGYAVLQTAFQCLCHHELEELFGLSRGYDRFAALLDRARQRHGKVADVLLPVFEEDWRQRDIARRRAQVKREDHRFFLALLLNVPQRSMMLRLVKEKFPDRDPVGLVVEWTKELASTKSFGSREPNVLGLENFDESHLYVFQALLEGLTVEQIESRASAAADFTAKLKRPISEVAGDLKSQPIFKSIFA